MGFAVTLNPLGALAGFANGIRGEATGSAINAVAGEQIGAGIEATIDFGASSRFLFLLASSLAWLS